MAEGPVAHVMEQGRRQQHAPVLLQGGLEGHQAIKGLAGQVQHPERMGKAARFGPMEGEKGRPQLADAPQALEGGAINQVHGQGLGRPAALEPDPPMQGVVVGALAHGCIAGAGWAFGVSSKRATRLVAALSSQESLLPPGSSGSGPANRWSGSMPWFWMSRPLGVA